MLLLHLFEYPYAREAFQEAQELEPGFAMAYWGEAMTYNFPIWDEQDLEGARAVMHRLGSTTEARLASTAAAREIGLLSALEVLYGPGQKSERDLRYMQAMEQLAVRFPEDHEIQLFYALSIFGVSAGVRDIPTYLLATAIAQAVFSDNPRHPGAAHYLIHGVDDPVHAVLGLRAARALMEMAPDAGHSQHMTSHIFTALGMWDDVAFANENAVSVANSMRLEKQQQPRHWGHYNFWLMYAHLQQGRHEKALELLKAARAQERESNTPPEDRMVLDPDNSLAGSVVQMWLRYLIDSRAWDSDVAGWSFNIGDAFDPNLNFSFAQSMRAAFAGQVSVAQAHLDQFRGMKAELEDEIGNLEEQAPKHKLYLQRLEVLDAEMQAGIEMARGEKVKAAELAAKASRLEGEMPFSFGPPFVDMPAAEFHAERLMDAGKFSEAAAAYSTQLERSRLRVQSLLGLAWAESNLGNQQSAKYNQAKLRAIWHAADDSIRRLAEQL
jgi:tetratricopeptide (TPR) repeat protein